MNKLARETGAVQRHRQVKIYDMVWVLVLGFATGRKRTLAGLRRRYERETDQTIEESSFYKRFSPRLAKLLNLLLSRVFEECRGVGRRLTVVGLDKWLKTNTVKRRTISLLRQGLMHYAAIPKMKLDMLEPLMVKYGELLREQQVSREVFRLI